MALILVLSGLIAGYSYFTGPPAPADVGETISSGPSPIIIGNGMVAVTGRDISERALKFVEDNMMTEDGDYEYYIIHYGSGPDLKSSADPDNTFFGDIDGGSLLNEMAYLAYREVGDRASADAEFRKLYAKCKSRSLCNGNVYAAVYREWQDTGNEEYRIALMFSKPGIYVPGTDSTPLGFSLQSLGFSYLIKKDAESLSAIDGQLQTGDVERAGFDPLSYEWFASSCQYARGESSLFEVDGDPGYMSDEVLSLSESITNSMGDGLDLNIVVSCGHALVNLYELTGNETYKESAEGLLSVVANSHPDFKKFSAATEDRGIFYVGAAETGSNIHSTVSILDAAFFAARLADSEVVLK
ncbi:MAG: hypothetical protein HY833_00810 [Candidatus Aenigmarchaeota archaeon]|nr:hypothetical protein [Candidatus Aenigmarchaeota archaeon]